MISNYHQKDLNIIKFFALIGIVLMNVEFFYTPPEALSWGAIASPEWLSRIIHVFIHGKFWTIFSLVFGSTLYLASERGLNFSSHKANMFALATLGAFHSVLWFGDILLSYAIAATLLFWVLHQKIARVCFFCLGLTVLGALWGYGSFGWVMAGFVFGAWCLYLGLYKKDMILPSLGAWAFSPMLMIFIGLGDFSPDPSFLAETQKTYVSQSSVLLSPSFFDNLFMNFFIALSKVFEQGMQIVMIAGVMGLGWGFAQQKVWEKPASWFLKHGLWGVPLAVLGVFASPKIADQKTFSLFQGIFEISHLGVALFWIGLILVFARAQKYYKAKEIMAKLGANSLSVYLIQTILGVAIYQWMFLLSKNYPQSLGVAVGIMLCAGLLVYFWLQKYPTGPFEIVRKKLSQHFLKPSK